MKSANQESVKEDLKNDQRQKVKQLTNNFNQDQTEQLKSSMMLLLIKDKKLVRK